ncbi:dicarboxylate/amino acid:cation symporter [Sphingosinicella sp. CPCC 101087]|uniref:dicarboxylate/amino acid:cation symporter n=1 Tax=Sphingosinicella sp. CPCC 101087 TaxID=2497754 RepID=UPI00101DED0D|nr:dicarboxylate/amino acid:cation symporter [Sphingosinicella sp. CPCC 101087]
MRTWFAIPLWQRVIGALILGVAVGLIWGPGAESIKWIGDFFIRAIRMLVVPLIFFSLVAGIAAIGDIRKLGAVGGRALVLFVGTGVASVALGLTLGTLIAPGAGLALTLPEGVAIPEPATTSVTDMILAMIPANPVETMARGDVLPLIVFALLFGIGILMAGEEGSLVARGMDAAAIVMQRMTVLVMELTPFGVFALMAWVAGTFGIDALLPLATLVGLNYLGCLLIIFGIYSAIIHFIGKVRVIDFFRGMIDAMAVAYSTASSNATLPVTLRCAQRNLGVSRSVSSFVISLGATINMNGTAMYLGLATLFGAQIFGVSLDFGDYVMIAITATLGAIGAAGIPGAGLIMMGLVFSTVGVPLETIAFVAGVDRIMDMMRTTTNITGDAAVAVAVARMTGDLDVGEFESADDV